MLAAYAYAKPLLVVLGLRVSTGLSSAVLRVSSCNVMHIIVVCIRMNKVDYYYCDELQGGPKKADTRFIFLLQLQQMNTDFNRFFTVITRNVLRINTNLCVPPHL